MVALYFDPAAPLQPAVTPVTALQPAAQPVTPKQRIESLKRTFCPSVPLVLPKTDAHVKPIAYVGSEDFIRGKVTVTVAPGGVGKSILTLVEAMALATGRDLLSGNPNEPLKYGSGHDPFAADRTGRTMLFSLEDDRPMVLMRMRAIANVYGIDNGDIFDSIHVLAADQILGMNLVYMEHGKIVINQDAIDAIVATLIENGIDKLVVDPLVAAHGIDENNNAAVQALVGVFRTIASQADCAVELIHHSRKLNGERTRDEDARGGSALIAAARTTRTLAVMDTDTARDFGVEEKDRHSIVGIYRDGKRNLSPRQGGVQWFQLKESVLYNGPFGAPWSKVGVPVHWSGKRRQTDDGTLRKVIEGLGREQYAEHARANDWIGFKIAATLDKDPSRDRAMVKAVIRDLEDKGLIEMTVGKNDNSQPKKFMRLTPLGLDILDGKPFDTPWGDETHDSGFLRLDDSLEDDGSYDGADTP